MNTQVAQDIFLFSTQTHTYFVQTDINIFYTNAYIEYIITYNSSFVILAQQTRAYLFVDELKYIFFI